MNDIDTQDQTFEVEAAWSDEYYERTERGYRQVPEGGDPCVICGRMVKADRGYDVRFIFGGPEAVRKDLEPEQVDGYTAGGDMGTWAVGPECGKAVPAAYRTARKGA